MDANNQRKLAELKFINPKLGVLIYRNGYLIIPDNSVDNITFMVNIRDFDLADFIEKNNQLEADLSTIEPFDFFKIVDIHVKTQDMRTNSAISGTTLTMEDQDNVTYLQPQTFKTYSVNLITPRNYYELLHSQTPLTEEEITEMRVFEAYIADLLLYEEYLMPQERGILDWFMKEMAKEMERAEISEEDLTAIKKQTFDNYNQMVDMKTQRQADKAKATGVVTHVIKPIQHNNKAGYISSILTIASALCFGIGIAILIVAKLQ